MPCFLVKAIECILSVPQRERLAQNIRRRPMAYLPSPPEVRHLGIVVGSIVGLLLAGAFGGCGRGGPQRVVISGTVTFNGQPLDRGQMRFIPEEGSGMPASGAYISKGEYVANSQGGVPVGQVKVQIECWQPTAGWLQEHGPPGPDARWDVIPKNQIIPEKYNAKTELEITIEPGSGSLTRDFALTD